MFALGYLNCSVWGFVLFASIISAILISCLFLKAKQIKIHLTYFLLCVVFVFAAFANSYFGIQLKREKAQTCVGEQYVEMLVISEETASENYTEYIVKIKKLDDEPVNFKAMLLCDFESEARVCDTIYAKAQISYLENGTTNSQRDILLTAAIEAETGAVYYSPEGESLWSKALSCGWDGISIAVNSFRHNTSEYFKELFGDEYGALAAGLIMNDKSDIVPETIRDFRRSGASHLLAVSGLHVSLLLGFFELILKKARVHKNARCALLAVIAVLLLGLAGFSVSACRSVFMLLILYISYTIMEENDSVTSLFVAVLVILLLSPYSVYDLGLWMSFLATLGLVSVYPLLAELIGNLFYSKLPHRRVFELLQRIMEITCATLVANVFLLPVMWMFFGEVSIASVPVNLLSSPIVAALLPCIAVGICVGMIPFLGDIFVVSVSFLSKLLLEIVSFFAKGSFATVSLSYSFASVVMWLFVIFFVAMLLIELKHKWLVFLPPVCAVLVFSVCLAVYNFTHGASLFYYSGNFDMLLSVDDGKADIIDVSGGSTVSYYDIIDFSKGQGAVVIDSVVIMDVEYKHVYCLEVVCRSNIVNRVYIPYPEDMQSTSVIRSIYSVAEKYGVELILFESGEELVLKEELSAKLEPSSVVLSCSGEEISYFRGETLGLAEEYAKKSEFAILKSSSSGASAVNIEGKILNVEKNKVIDIKELLG